MFKKLVMVAVLGAVAVAALKGTKAFSYARQEAAAVREWAESQVPPEKEIQRLRSEVRALDGDILRVAGQLAKENYEVRELRDHVAEYRVKQAEQKVLLKARGDAIKSATEQVSFGERSVPVSVAKQELDESVRRFTHHQKTLESLEQTLSSRERTRTVLEKQLDTLKDQKKELASTIDALVSEINVLKLQQMESKYSTDNTRLSGIKESIREMRKKIEIEREKLKLAPVVFEDGPKPSAATNRSVDEILAPLAGEKPARPAKPAKPTVE